MPRSARGKLWNIRRHAFIVHGKQCHKRSDVARVCGRRTHDARSKTSSRPRSSVNTHTVRAVCPCGPRGARAVFVSAFFALRTLACLCIPTLAAPAGHKHERAERRGCGSPAGPSSPARESLLSQAKLLNWVHHPFSSNLPPGQDADCRRALRVPPLRRVPRGLGSEYRRRHCKHQHPEPHGQRK